MKRLSSKLAAILLVAVMAVSLFPLSSLAETADGVGNEDLIVAEQQTTVENEVVADETTVEETTSEETAAEVTTPDVTTGEETVSGKEPAAETPVEETAPVEEPKEEAPVEVAAPVEEPVVIPENSITSQPQDALVAPNKKAVFEIETNGKVASYQWQYSANGGRYWKNLNSASYYKTNNQSSIVVTGYNSWFSSNNGYKYRCIVTFKDKKKSKVTSDVATLYVGGTLSVKSTKSKSASNAEVSVKAPEATFPAGTTLEVADVDSADYIDAINTVLEDTAAAEVTAVDISFKYDGEEVEPANDNKVTVTLKSDAVKEGVKLVHIDDEGIATLVAEEDIVSIKNGEIIFKSDAFSVYAVIGGSDDEARAQVEFYNGDTKLATMYVKNSDTEEELKTILYDPSTGELGEKQQFMGWTLDKVYNSESDIKDIDAVRSYMAAYEITEGATMPVIKFYAAIADIITLTYYDDKGESILKQESASMIGTDTSVSFLVKAAFTPSLPTQNFEGWQVKDGEDNIISPKISGADEAYENGTTTLVVKGDVELKAYAPEGRWLVFDENGKGATYCAPQFVKTGTNTNQPRPDSDMTRKGYTFGGWYTEQYGDDDEPEESKKFEFGHTLSEGITIYAYWIPNQTAPYTVVFWTQNLNRDGYDLKASYPAPNGTVGQNIPYTSVDNKDEDYVTLPGQSADTYHYTGFCLTEASKGQQVEITADGEAVLNLYYDRIEYNLRFYYYREQTGRNPYTYANNSNAGNNVWGIATWHNASNNHPTQTYGPDQTDTVEGYTAHYFVLNAYYGEDISSRWPRYDQLTGVGNNQPVSFIMMVGTTQKPRPSAGGDGTVKGVISTMDEKILGATNEKNGNFMIIRFPNSSNNWRYHIWYETVSGEDHSTEAGYTTHSYGGKTYYTTDALTLVVRSSNTDINQQNAPQYQGFADAFRRNQNWNGDGSWTTSNPTLYHINYVYDRLFYKITYMDGVYVDADTPMSPIAAHSEEILGTSDDIAYHARISETDQNYQPTKCNEEGFVFAGWYADAACQTPMNWGTMPMGGIKVYAKWIQKEYRILMHPNAGTAEDGNDLDWGSDTVNMSFKLDYKGKISTPTGTLSGYEFVGWYRDEGFGEVFMKNTAITDDNASEYDNPETPEYDPTDPTELDKWGTPNPPNYNKDADLGRFWVVGKVDLYAKWNKIAEGAPGVNVVYDAGKGSDPPTDNNYYDDGADVVAQSASKGYTETETVEGEEVTTEYLFDCWVVQKWNGSEYVDTAVEVYPGGKFTMILDDAKQVIVEQDAAGNIKKATYTLQLRAKYIPKEKDTPTYINWYENTAEGDPVHTDEDIQINKGVDIYDIATDTDVTIQRGYIFLGWAREPEYELDAQGKPVGDPITYYDGLTEDDLYLKYDSATGKYQYKDGTTWKAFDSQEVAADEKQPYHALYAVWDKVFYIIHGNGTRAESVEVVKISDTTERNKFTTGYDKENSKYTSYYYGGYGVLAGAQTEPTPSGFALQKGGNEATYSGTYEWSRTNAKKSATAFDRGVGDIYYLKEVPVSYLASPQVAAVVGDYGRGDLTSVTALSVVDTTIYRSGGISGARGAFATTFTMQQNDGATEQYAVSDLFDVEEGFFIVAPLSKEEGNYELNPFWITYDGITVNSNASRTIQISGNSVTDVTP